jgi:hypothetical protein
MTHAEFRQKFVAAVKDADWMAIIDQKLAAVAVELLCGEKVAPPARMADEIQRAFEGCDDYGIGEFDIANYPETLKRIVYAAFNRPTKLDQTTTTGQA